MRKAKDDLVHVGIKVQREIKQKWEALAKKDERSLSKWIYVQIEGTPAKPKP